MVVVSDEWVSVCVCVCVCVRERPAVGCAPVVVVSPSACGCCVVVSDVRPLPVWSLSALALPPQSARMPAVTQERFSVTWSASHTLTQICCSVLPYWSSPPPALVSWVSEPRRSVGLSQRPAPVSVSPDCLSLSAALPPSVSALRRAASDPPAPEYHTRNMSFNHCTFLSSDVTSPSYFWTSLMWPPAADCINFILY